MARPVWNGSITFGLVNVPVRLYSAESKNDLHFHLIDSRNHARVRYERVNEVTGEEVPWNQIIKGYEYDDGNYVLLQQEEFEKASVRMSKTIDIEGFVDVNAVPLTYYDRPYFVEPAKGAEKGYVLLREALKKSGGVGITKVVIRTRQHLALLMPKDDILILEILRFPQELREPSEFNFPGGDLRKSNVSKKEIDLAEQLIDGMSADWEPKEYHDEYRQALMQFIEKKIKSGKQHEVYEAEEEAEEEPRHINFVELLRKSVAESKGGKAAPSRSSKRSSKSNRRRAKKKAG